MKPEARAALLLSGCLVAAAVGATGCQPKAKRLGQRHTEPTALSQEGLAFSKSMKGGMGQMPSQVLKGMLGQIQTAMHLYVFDNEAYPATLSQDMREILDYVGVRQLVEQLPPNPVVSYQASRLGYEVVVRVDAAGTRYQITPYKIERL